MFKLCRDFCTVLGDWNIAFSQRRDKYIYVSKKKNQADRLNNKRKLGAGTPISAIYSVFLRQITLQSLVDQSFFFFYFFLFSSSLAKLPLYPYTNSRTVAW